LYVGVIKVLEEDPVSGFQYLWRYSDNYIYSSMGLFKWNIC